MDSIKMKNLIFRMSLLHVQFIIFQIVIHFSLSLSFSFWSCNLNITQANLCKDCITNNTECFSSNLSYIDDKSCSHFSLLKPYQPDASFHLFDKFNCQVLLKINNEDLYSLKFFCDNFTFDEILSNNKGFNSIEKVHCLIWSAPTKSYSGLQIKIRMSHFNKTNSKYVSEAYKPMINKFDQFFNLNLNEENTSWENNFNASSSNKFDFILLIGFSIPVFIIVVLLIIITVRNITDRRDEEEENVNVDVKSEN